MDSGTIETAQTSMCNEIYRVFSSLVAELTDLCVKSQMSLDEYKQSLPNLAIPNTLIDEFIAKRNQVIGELIEKSERAVSLFPVIDYVDEALSEIEETLSKLESQCDAVISTCQDRRPKKTGMLLFNKKAQTGTDVPPPTWSHPDYIFNVDTMITKLKQIQDVCNASYQQHVQEEKNRL